MSIHRGLISNHQIYGLNLGLTRVKKTMTSNNNLTFTGSEEKTIASITGKGVVTCIWIRASEYSLFMKNGLLKIYVDSEETPSIQFDMGSLGTQLASGYITGWSANTWAEVNATKPSEMMCLKFLIPYSTSIEIKIESTIPQTATSVCTYVIYEDGVDIPLRLNSANVTYSSPETILATDATEYEFLDSTGCVGWLVWHSMAILADTDNSYLNSTINLYFDSEVSPSISTQNLLNWFQDSNDFNAQHMSTPWKMLSICQDGAAFKKRCNVGINLLSLCGGIKFCKSLRFTMDTSPASMATDFDFGYTVLYYLEV